MQDTYLMHAQTNTVLQVFHLKEKLNIQSFDAMCKSIMAIWQKCELRSWQAQFEEKRRAVKKKRADAEAAPVFQLLFQYTD